MCRTRVHIRIICLCLYRYRYTYTCYVRIRTVPRSAVPCHPMPCRAMPCHADKIRSYHTLPVPDQTRQGYNTYACVSRNGEGRQYTIYPRWKITCTCLKCSMRCCALRSELQHTHSQCTLHAKHSQRLELCVHLFAFTAASGHDFLCIPNGTHIDLCRILYIYIYREREIERDYVYVYIYIYVLCMCTANVSYMLYYSIVYHVIIHMYVCIYIYIYIYSDYSILHYIIKRSAYRVRMCMSFSRRPSVLLPRSRKWVPLPIEESLSAVLACHWLCFSRL